MALTGRTDSMEPLLARRDTSLLDVIARLVSSTRLPLSDFSFSLALFSVLLVTAGFGQYIFFAWNTSPAVIWPPTGIALAAVLLRGYRMWIPIACAFFVATLFSPSHPSFIFIAVATLAQPIAP